MPLVEDADGSTGAAQERGSEEKAADAEHLDSAKVTTKFQSNKATPSAEGQPRAEQDGDHGYALVISSENIDIRRKIAGQAQPRLMLSHQSPKVRLNSSLVGNTNREISLEGKVTSIIEARQKRIQEAVHVAQLEKRINSIKKTEQKVNKRLEDEFLQSIQRWKFQEEKKYRCSQAEFNRLSHIAKGKEIIDHFQREKMLIEQNRQKCVENNRSIVNQTQMENFLLKSYKKAQEEKELRIIKERKRQMQLEGTLNYIKNQEKIMERNDSIKKEKEDLIALETRMTKQFQRKAHKLAKAEQ